MLAWSGWVVWVDGMGVGRHHELSVGWGEGSQEEAQVWSERMRGEEEEEEVGVKWRGGPTGGMGTARAGEVRELRGKDGDWKAGRGKWIPQGWREEKHRRN